MALRILGGCMLAGGLSSIIYWMGQRYITKEKIKKDLINASHNETQTKYGVKIRIIDLDIDKNITTVNGGKVVYHINTTYKSNYELNPWRCNSNAPMYIYVTKREDKIVPEVSESQIYLVNTFDPTFGLDNLAMNNESSDILKPGDRINLKIKSTNHKYNNFDFYWFFKIFGYSDEIAEKYVYGKDKLFPLNYNSFGSDEYKFVAGTRLYLIGKEKENIFYYDALYDTPDDIAYSMADNKMSDDFWKKIVW
jgi:hypothetical protein